MTHAKPSNDFTNVEPTYARPGSGPLATRSSIARRWPARAARGVGSSILTLAVSLVLAAGVSDASSSPGASAADAAPVLFLGNEHVGMTAEQIEASQAARTIEPTTDPAPAVVSLPSDPQARADALVAIAAEAQQRAAEAEARAEAAKLAVEAAERAESAERVPAPAVTAMAPVVAAASQQATGYSSCVEASVRRGVAYVDADRDCRAIAAEGPE